MKSRTFIRKIEFLALGLLLLALLVVPVVAPPDIQFFPTVAEPGPSMQALNSGFLVNEGGCLRLWYFGESSLLIWPYGYSYRTSWSRIEVLDENGEVIARSGTFVRLAGGETTQRGFNTFIEKTGQEPPPGCNGPYWVVGGVAND